MILTAAHYSNFLPSVFTLAHAHRTPTSFFLSTTEITCIPSPPPYVLSIINALHGGGETLLAVHNGLTAFTGPSDELFQEIGNLLDKVKTGFKGLL
jgi:hypothetical protein